MSNSIKFIDAVWLQDLDKAPQHLVDFHVHRQAGGTYKNLPESIRRHGGYHEFSLFEQRQRALELGEVVDPSGWTDLAFAQWVEAQRLNYQGGLDLGNRTGLSWAEISVRCGVGEAVVRRFFTQSANADSKGLRIGHGGRFVEGDPSHYQAEAKRHGWIRPTSGTADLAPALQARLALLAGSVELAEEFTAKTAKELKAELKELGQPTSGTKAQLVERLMMALND